MNTDHNLRPTAAYREIEAALEVDETCVWWSKPEPSMAISGAWPISAVGATLCIVSVHLMRYDNSGGLWALVAIGLGFTQWPLYGYHWARNAVYAITNRRLLAVNGRWWRKISSRPISTLVDVEFRPTDGRRGAVAFDFGMDEDNEPDCLVWDGVEDAGLAERILRTILSERTSGTNNGHSRQGSA